MSNDGNELESESSLDICSSRRTRCIQSQQRRAMVHDTHSCSQHCLVLEQAGLELVLER